MNDLEANALLTKAGLIDPRSKTQADRAIAWAEVLDDVTLEEGMTALREHLRSSTDPVMPAHILRLALAARIVASEARHHEETRRMLTQVKDAVPMPPDLRAAFSADARRGRSRLRSMLSKPRPVRELSSPERREGIEKARAELDAMRDADAS